MIPIDLSGRWRAALADPERRRRFSAPDLDDGGDPDWHDLEVPGHWRCAPPFADTDGPILYRRRFDVDSTTAPGERFGGDSPPSGPARWWLVLDGVFYQGDVWLDGRYLGDTEGYFFAHQFEATDAIAARTEHLLAVEVACPPQTDRTHKRNLTGSLQHSSWLDPAWNPGGIWRTVRLVRTGPLRIRHARLRCIEATEQQAVLALRAVIDATSQTTATLRTTAGPSDGTGAGVDHELEHIVAAGENRVEWTITIDRPARWWPHALGDQALHDIDVEVFHPDDGPEAQPSDNVQFRTGLRTVRMDRWIVSVNGERLFCKGTNLGPTRQALGAASTEEITADVAAAKDLGMDLIRVHSHIARPELYDAADEAGMLVWQDLPLQWAYHRGVRQQALRQAREAVDLLAHRPSVAVWCGHSEPLPGGLDAAGRDPGATRRDQLRRQVGQVLPSWNKNRLDPSIRRALRTTDGTRPVISGSGLLPQLPMLDGTDTHLFYGWEYGDIDDLAAAAARWPRLVRFVSEFGAQSVPTSADFCEPHRWPDLDWERLGAAHGLRRDLLDRIADPADHETFEQWRAATQAHQAALLRRQIEALRLLKYRPTGGFAQFLLADGHPAISHSLLDHDRQPKAAYDAVKAACAPVVVLARTGPASRRNALALDLYLVSDRRDGIDQVTVEATLDGQAPRRWTSDLGPDSCSFVGTVEVATSVEPQAVLDLRADAPGVEPLTTNRYVVDPSRGTVT